MLNLDRVKVGEFILDDGKVQQVVGKSDKRRHVIVVTHPNGWYPKDHQCFVDEYGIPSIYHNKKCYYVDVGSERLEKILTGQYAEA